MRLTIVCDNNSYNSRLRTAWGFACWLQRGKTNLLFDVGGDASILLSNMGVLGFDPCIIDLVVLSHMHRDHVGGLIRLLENGARPQVYLPASFPTRFKLQLRKWVIVHEVNRAQEILPGIWTTGEIGTSIREQGLIVKTDKGSVLITGCAHPGIVEMVRQTVSIFDKRVCLVVGGFHLSGASIAKIREVCAAFRLLGVQKLAPCHCTGEKAMNTFAAEFGDDYLRCGAGLVIAS